MSYAAVCYHGAAGAGLLPVLIDRRDAFPGSTMLRATSLAEIIDIVAGRSAPSLQPKGGPARSAE